MTQIRTEGNLDALVNHVIEKAKDRARAKMARAEEEAKRLLAEAEREAQAKEEELVRQGQEEISRERHQVLSQTRLKLREELLATKARIFTDLLKQVERSLLELCSRNGPEYLKGIVAFVRGVLAETRPEKLVLYLSPRDLERYREELPQALQGEGIAQQVELRGSDIAGGVVVELPELGLQFDASLSQLLREIRPRLENLLQERVFSPAEGGEG